jgi:hypothetical protein
VYISVHPVMDICKRAHGINCNIFFRICGIKEIHISITSDFLQVLGICVISELFNIVCIKMATNTLMFC